jgi:hypothetical protein
VGYGDVGFVVEADECCYDEVLCKSTEEEKGTWRLAGVWVDMAYCLQRYAAVHVLNVRGVV